jgi:DNA-binding transcriptional ArsR family regulator/ubiquinone/menaquinone biosynthesis C-methylase UbiE
MRNGGQEPGIHLGHLCFPRRGVTFPPDMDTHDEAQANILKALADESRLRLARLLAREEMSVQELCEVLDLPQPKVSRHLSVLRAAGLVRDQREGSRVYYSLAPLDDASRLIADYLKAVAEQDHPDLERMAAILRKRARLSQDFSQQRADDWDQLGIQLHSSTAALFALAALSPRGLRIVDLGTGTGLLLPFLAGLGGQVYAVDHSQEMLDHAQQRCEALGLNNVTFLRSAADELADHLPEPCDALLMHFVLHQMASPASTLKAMRAALKTGGRLVIVDRTKHEDEAARRDFGSLWLGFEQDKVEKWLQAADLGMISWQVLRHQNPAYPFSLFIAAASRLD